LGNASVAGVRRQRLSFFSPLVIFEVVSCLANLLGRALCC
jgi:hypothetical protein